VQFSPVIQLFLELAAIIAAAQLGGMLTRRLGQPRVLGELLAGVILGPSVLDLSHAAIFTSPHLEETISDLAELGVLVLMFNIGLGVHLSESSPFAEWLFWAELRAEEPPPLRYAGYAGIQLSR
jgi:Kef-type K+ transport system membrane component KefB